MATIVCVLLRGHKWCCTWQGFWGWTYSKMEYTEFLPVPQQIVWGKYSELYSIHVDWVLYHLCQMIAVFLIVGIYFNMHLLTLLLPGLLQRHSRIFLWRPKWVQKFLEKVRRKPWLLSLLSCKTCSKAENPCFESRFFLQVGVNIIVPCLLLN